MFRRPTTAFAEPGRPPEFDRSSVGLLGPPDDGFPAALPGLFCRPGLGVDNLPFVRFGVWLLGWAFPSALGLVAFAELLLVWTVRAFVGRWGAWCKKSIFRQQLQS